MRTVISILILQFSLTFSLYGFDISAVNFPANYDGLNGNDGPISCDDSYPQDELGNPHPSLTGEPSSDDCDNIGISYEDAVLPLCGSGSGSFKIIREWIVVDWCTGQTHIQDQIIKIIDQDPPELSGSADLTVSTGSSNCYYMLNDNDFDLSVTDNCDDNLNFQLIPNEGTILPKGNHTIIAQVQDDCGNVGEYTFNLTVEDQVPPVAVVDNNFSVTLSSGGEGYIYKTSFDEGSHDRCGPVELSVRRIEANPCGLSTEWGDAVEFCCSDVAISPVKVEFRVMDHSGNVNYAWINVTVEDKLPPNIECPDDVELGCLDDYYSIVSNAGVELNNLPVYVKEVLGNPSFGATCSASIQYSTNGNINNCEDSEISITWLIQTESGESDGCIQRLNIIRNDENKLNCDDIFFPVGSPERQVYGSLPWCEVNDGQNDQDDNQPPIQITDCGSASINWPLIDYNQLCSAIGINQTLDTFNFADGACKKIISHWEIIDQCTFDENFVDPVTGQIDPFHSDNGYFEFFAEYDLFDNEGPEVECVQDYVVNCGSTFDEVITAEASDNCSSTFGWGWDFDLNNDGSIDASGAGKEISAGSIGLNEIPTGSHRVVWHVNDGCGNNTNETCIINISFEDNKAPTPYCHLSLTTVVSEDTGEVEIWASDFDRGSFDDCTSQENLQFSFSPFVADSFKVFDCNTLGFNFVPLFVTDEAGNQDFCLAFLTVFDNGHCQDLMNLSGRVMMENEEAVPDALVSLSRNGLLLDESITDEEGTYSFETGAFEQMELSVNIEGDPLNGVSTQDLINIHRHIIGSEPLDSPYKLLAADINNSGNNSVIDVVHLRRLILGYYEEFPENDSWRAIPHSLKFEDMEDVYDASQSLKLENSQGNIDFIAVKIGDVDGSADLSGALSSVVRESSILKLESIGNQIHFISQEDHYLDGFQLEITYDDEKLKVDNILSSILNLSSDNFRIADGKITISYSNLNKEYVARGESLFHLNLTESISQWSNLEISNDRIKAEIYSGSAVKNLTLENVSDNISDLGLLNYPNPFESNHILEFNLNESINVPIVVVNSIGQMIHQETIQGVKGFNKIELSSKIFEGPGLYFLNVEMAGKKIRRSLIKLD